MQQDVIPSDLIPVSQDLESQAPIPSAWRATLTAIVDAMSEGDWALDRGVPTFQPVSRLDANRMAKNVEDYGVHLTRLPDATWQTSVCQWYETYWDTLIDLYSSESGLTDLVLATRVFPTVDGFSYEIHGIYVP